MLTKIQIHNINAILDSTINFEKSRYHFLDDNIYNDKIVNPIGFYGTNGSGKTSFVQAISQLIEILWKEPGNYSLFIPNLINIDRISSIKLWFILDEDEYIYEIKTDYLYGIVGEELIINNDICFNKIDKESYSYNNNINKLSSPTFSVLRKLGNELVNDKITKAYNFISNISFIDASKKRFLSKNLSQKSINDLMVEQSEEVKNILSTYNNFPIYSYCSKNNKDGTKEYFFKMNINKKDYELPSVIMSGGMMNQSAILSIFTTLPEGSVLIIDEIEDALHPITIMSFLEVIKQRRIQLIFTSHNTYILQKLRPDQIIFSNWNNGCSNYKKLSDIYPNIREVNNIEKMYLSHLFDEEITK